MASQDLAFAADDDGYLLTGTLLHPETDANGPVVVVGIATGTKRGYYIPFCTFLAESGIPTLVFDWRGTGGSAPDGGLRASKATWDDWAERDMRGALRFMHERFPQRELVLVGHSVGAHVLARATGTPQDPYSYVTRVVSVSAQHAYWNLSRFPQNIMFCLMWYVVAPVTTAVCGYFPARKLGLFDDLPAGVALQWASMCRSPFYFVDATGKRCAPGFDSQRAPMLVVSSADDEFATHKQIRAFHDRFTHAPLHYENVRPRDVGAKRIGHVGFFRRQFKDTLWQQALAFIRSGEVRPLSAYQPQQQQQRGDGGGGVRVQAVCGDTQLRVYSTLVMAPATAAPEQHILARL